MTFVTRMAKRTPALRHYAENRGWVFMLFVAILVYPFALTIVIQSSLGVDFFGEHFTSQETVEDALQLDITPTLATWCSGWIAVFVLVLAVAVYALDLVFVRNKRRGGFLYYSPPFWPILTFFTLVVALFFMAASSVAYFLLLPQWAFVFAALLTLFVAITLGSAFNGLECHGQELINDGFRKDVIAFIIVVQNGLAFFVAWAAIWATYIFGQVLVYEIKTVSVKDAGSTVLAILGFDLLVYFCFMLFIYRKKLRFIFTPFIAYIWFHAGVLVENWDGEERNAVFALVMTLVAAVLLCLAVAWAAHSEHGWPVFNWCPERDDVPPSYDESADVEQGEGVKHEEAEKDRPAKEEAVKEEAEAMKEAEAVKEAEGAKEDKEVFSDGEAGKDTVVIEKKESDVSPKKIS